MHLNDTPTPDGNSGWPKTEREAVLALLSALGALWPDDVQRHEIRVLWPDDPDDAAADEPQPGPYFAADDAPAAQKHNVDRRMGWRFVSITDSATGLMLGSRVYAG